MESQPVWASRNNHRDLLPVLALLGMDGHQFALFQRNSHKYVGRGGGGKQQVGNRHHGREPEYAQPTHIERMAHDAI